MVDGNSASVNHGTTKGFRRFELRMSPVRAHKAIQRCKIFKTYNIRASVLHAACDGLDAGYIGLSLWMFT